MTLIWIAKLCILCFLPVPANKLSILRWDKYVLIGIQTSTNYYQNYNTFLYTSPIALLNHISFDILVILRQYLQNNNFNLKRLNYNNDSNSICFVFAHLKRSETIVLKSNHYSMTNITKLLENHCYTIWRRYYLWLITFRTTDKKSFNWNNWKYHFTSLTFNY